jgi:hypothetical protein
MAGLCEDEVPVSLRHRVACAGPALHPPFSHGNPSHNYRRAWRAPRLPHGMNAKQVFVGRGGKEPPSRHDHNEQKMKGQK